MFTSQVEAILKSVVLDSHDDQRIARCVLHVTPLSYELAKEVSAHIADRLYRLNGRHEFVPCLEVTSMSFNEKIPPQRMEFRPHPDVAVPGGVFQGVEIRGLQAFRPKSREEFALVLQIRFEIGERGVASKFLIDLYKQTCFLSFSDMQRGLPLEHPQERPLSGQFITDRAKTARTGFRGQAGL